MAQISDKLAVYTLGHTGVVIDQNPLEPSVPDDSLRAAENAMHDPTMGYGGGIRKRPGLQRFNSQYAGGVILGGIPMPVAGTGGAPASGGGAIIGTGDSGFDGGLTGDSTGTGDMTGAPGGTFDGGAITTTPAGASAFTGGSTLFNGARLVVVAKIDSTASNTGGVGWYVAPKGLTSNAIGSATPTQASVYQYPPNATFTKAYGRPGCIDTIGTTGLYFAGNMGDQVSGLAAAPTVYRTNGGTAQLIATLPRSTQSIANVTGSTKLGLVSFQFVTGGAGYSNGDTISLVGGTGTAAQFQKTANGFVISSAGSYSVAPINPVTVSGGTGSGTISATFGATPIRNAIVDMHYGTDGFIYICVKDKYDAQDTAGSAGRVIRLSPLSGQTVEWNLGTTDGAPEAFAHVPYTSCYFDGKLYVGTFPDAQGETATVLASNGSSAIYETSFAPAARASAYGFLSCMQIYNGRLFMGTGDWNASPAFATLWSRRPGDLLVDSISAWNSQLVASGGVATSGNYFVSMVVFNDELYASWFGNNTFGAIYKIVADNPGVETSTSFTTSTVLSVASAFRLWVDDGLLYAIAEGDSATPICYTSPDGSVWTEKTGALTDLGVTARARNVFFGLNQ